jgi:hypothetical protein
MSGYDEEPTHEPHSPRDALPVRVRTARRRVPRPPIARRRSGKEIGSNIGPYFQVEYADGILESGGMPGERPALADHL